MTEATGHNAFGKYGHICFLLIYDPLEIAFPKKDLKSIFLRNIYSLIMVADDNPRSKKHLKSQAAINFEKAKHLKLRHWMIHPFSQLRVFWETWMSLVLITAFITTPYDVFFPTDDVYELEMAMMQLIINVTLFLDIIGNFRTGYHTINAEIEMDLTTVRKTYFYGRFFIDLFATVPYLFIIERALKDNIYEDTQIRLLHCLRLFVITKLKTLFVYLRRLGDVFEVDDVVMNLLSTTIFYGLFIHFMTCLQLLPWLSKTEDYTWIAVAGIWESNAFVKYIVCLYRAVSIVANVSHGSYSPRTTEDVFVIGMVAALGCLVCYYLLSEISQFVTAKQSTKSRYEVLVQQLRQYSLFKGFTERTRERIISYYDFRFKGSYYREDQILNCISIQLRQEVIMHKCRRLVENVVFFNRLPVTLLGNIVACLKLEIFLANDVIIRYGDIGDCMYFIASGTVAVYSKTGKEVCHLEDGGHFGEVALVVREASRVASVVSIETCELYRLDTQEFLHAVVPYPDLYKEIEHIALERQENILFMDDLHALRSHNVNPEGTFYM